MANRTKLTVGVILAGGLSSRMGEFGDKGLFAVRGQTQHERCFELFRQAHIQGYIDEIVMSRAEHVPSLPQVHTIADNFCGAGPLAGIEASVRYALTHLLPCNSDKEPKVTLVFMPIDLPFFNGTHLAYLLTENNHAYRQHGIQAMHYEDQPLPLIINASHTILEQIQEKLRSGRRLSLWRLAQQLNASQLTMPSAFQLHSPWHNCNTLQDWEEVLR